MCIPSPFLFRSPGELSPQPFLPPQQSWTEKPKACPTSLVLSQGASRSPAASGGREVDLSANSWSPAVALLQVHPADRGPACIQVALPALSHLVGCGSAPSLPELLNLDPTDSSFPAKNWLGGAEDQKKEEVFCSTFEYVTSLPSRSQSAAAWKEQPSLPPISGAARY